MPKKPNAKTTTPKKKIYCANLNVLGKTYQGQGSSVSEAINSLKPGVVRGRCILTVSCGRKQQERILMPLAVQRLFNTHGLAREAQLKNVALTFGI